MHRGPRWKDQVRVLLTDALSPNMMRTIFKNARIFTALADGNGEHDCMIIAGDKIEYVGNGKDSLVRQLEAEGAEVRDIDGGLLAPGFIDG